MCEHERGLADARLSTEQDERAWNKPAAEHAIYLANAQRDAFDVGRGCVAERRGRGSGYWRAQPRFGAMARVGTAVSTSVFHSPQERHWPSQRRLDAPHVPHT